LQHNPVVCTKFPGIGRREAGSGASSAELRSTDPAFQYLARSG
jgi:hypothetical protein